MLKVSHLHGSAVLEALKVPFFFYFNLQWYVVDIEKWAHAVWAVEPVWEKQELEKSGMSHSETFLQIVTWRQHTAASNSTVLIGITLRK